MAATTSRIASFLSRVIPRKAGSSTWQRGLSVFSSAHHLGDIDARLNASHVKEVFRSMAMQVRIEFWLSGGSWPLAVKFADILACALIDRTMTFTMI